VFSSIWATGKFRSHVWYLGRGVSVFCVHVFNVAVAHVRLEPLPPFLLVLVLHLDLLLPLLQQVPLRVENAQLRLLVVREVVEPPVVVVVGDVLPVDGLQ
jgi:hypothetical protein